MNKINEFKELIRDYIGPSKSVVDTKVSNVTAPGENYMSEIIRINVTLKNDTTGKQEELSMVAKLVIDAEIVNGGTTAIITKNEVVFYKEVIPVIQEFQRRHNLPVLDLFPKFIAGRLNLNGSDVADTDAVLILEDLSPAGFKNLDRMKGFDLNGAKLVLNNMAMLHAELLAMRLLEPETYEAKIRSNAQGLKPNDPDLKKRAEFFEQPVNLLTLVENILKTDEECRSQLRQFKSFIVQLKASLAKNTDNFFGKMVRDDFETLVHYDMWTNNVMQTFEDGNPVQTVFVDFQMYRSVSCATDLIFFLITSVQIEYLRSNFEYLLKYYYEIFSSTLKKSGIVDSKYSYDQFLESIKRVSESVVYQVIFMVLGIIHPNTDVGGNDQMYSLKIENVSPTAKDKIIFMFQQAFKRGWLEFTKCSVVHIQFVAMERVKNFEELIRDYIGPNKTIVEAKTGDLTAPGENYLSDMIKIDLILKDTVTNKTEDLNVVAKLVTDNHVMGPTSDLTKAEVYFYKVVVPAIKSFHKKYSLPYPSFYPDYIGGRINLTGEVDKADKDAVLVLENLVTKGYKNLDRHVGFDLDTSKMILKDLATFHGVPLAMRLLEPEEFGNLTKDLKLPFPDEPPKDKEGKPGPPDQPIFNILIKIFNDNGQENVAAKFSKMIEYHKEKMTGHKKNERPVSAFSTIIHHDMWLNNTMQKIVNGVTVKNKFCDFQMCEVNSPTIDLMLFLFSSVELRCLENNVDNLIKFYHEELVNILKKLNVYSEEYCYKKLLEEFRNNCQEGMFQALMMIPTIIFSDKGKIFKLGSPMAVEDVPPMALKKLILMCEEAADRDWF
uniref:Uncharacterized protein LOC114325692 n=1 Tax=Diabrotica virgifera virgifera TaxID=50390 RepID=A0A6P7F1X3_DIAVI